MKNKKIIFFSAVIIILMLLGGGGIWFSLTNVNMPKVENELVVSPIPSHDPPKQDYPVLLVNLQTQNNSGQSGTAKFEGMAGNKTKVTLSLEGGNFNQQPAHIHNGSCPNPGGIKYPLTSVNSGWSETVVNVNLESLVKSGALAINVHKSAEETQVYTACGNLPKPL